MQRKIQPVQRARLQLEWLGHPLPLRVIVSVLMILAAGGGGLAGTSGVHAQQAGGPPCDLMPPLLEMEVDARLGRLDVVGAAEDVTDEDGRTGRGFVATLGLPAVDDQAEQVKCISIAMHGPGQHYESGTISTLQPDATEFRYSPRGVAGEYCFRFVLLTETTRSEFTESCIELPQQLPPGPVTSEPTPGAPDAGYGIAPEGSESSRMALVVIVALGAGLAAAFGPGAIRRALSRR